MKQRYLARILGVHTMENITLNGIHCTITTQGVGGPVLFWANSPEFGERFSVAAESLKNSTENPFVLFQFEFPSWNNDFSPWHMESEGMKFGDGGNNTLQWIMDCAIPYVKEKYPESEKYAICGYSLAGLFSLWSFYENEIFDGVACCSGSLWFEGWSEYASQRKLSGERSVYLSLGGKEPGSGNKLTKTIGEKYNNQRDLLKKNNIKTKFENNPGGHFSDLDGRMVKSFVWLIENL